MSALSSDLGQFLEVVGKVSASVADEPGCVADAWGSVESAGLPTLARDTADEPDAFQWLAHTVRVAAGTCPALAYVLAGRYTADLTIESAGAGVPTFALASRDSRPVVATAPDPDLVVIHDVDSSDTVVVLWGAVKDSVEVEQRTGLAAARPKSFPVPSTAESYSAEASSVLTSWDLLLGAALVGIADRAVRATQTYVLERKQFGMAIGSFAGLRALVAEMQLRVEPVRALLDLTAANSGPGESVAALAGRAAVANCIDAIQAHGGYGYITEYPVADLLRDAVSLQARAGGRRLHVARVARRGLGAPDGGRS